MKVLYTVRKNASNMTSVSSFGDVPRVMRGFLFAILFVGLIIPVLSNLAVSDSGPSKPVIHSFEATPGIINPTENATLSWNVSDATNITINPGDFWLEVNKTEATGRSMLNGSMIVHPNNSTNYTLTAENAFGNSTANTSLIIKGSYASSSEASNPVINYFSAYPSSIRAGEGSVLSWSVSNAASVTISGLGNVALKGSAAVMPKLTSRYRPHCREWGWKNSRGARHFRGEAKAHKASDKLLQCQSRNDSGGRELCPELERFGCLECSDK